MTRADSSDRDAPVVRATALISAVTLAARIAGFARWIALGAAVGTTYLGNVYQTANLIPNVVFELIAGGLLAAVLVPVFVVESGAGPGRVSLVASSLANMLLAVAVPLVIAGIVFGRPIMRLMLAGVADPAVREQQIELGAWFLRFFLPQVPLYLLGMVMQGILHAHRRFVVSAIGPLLSSLTVIATYLVFRSMGPAADIGHVSRGRLVVLAGGTTLGVVALTLCQLPPVWRLGVRWRPRLALHDPAVRSALRAGAWGAVFVAVTQAFILVAVALANRVEGGVVAYQIANAFFELPNALIGLPVAISLYPALAESFAARDEPRFATLLSSGWRLVAFAGPGAGAALVVLAGPAAASLLGWTGHVRAALVSGVLVGLAVGAPAWALMSTLIRGLYARGAASAAAAVNAVAFGVLLAVAGGATLIGHPRGAAAMRVLGAGIAAAWWVAAAVAVVVLSRRARSWNVAADVRALAAGVARALAVGAACLAGVRIAGGASMPVRLLAGLTAGGVATALLMLRSSEARRLVRLLRGGTAT